MTAQEKVAPRKLSMLQLAAELKNVSEACRIMGYSRSKFYEIKRAFQGGGVDRVYQSCGKEFKVLRCVVERDEGLYCSKACFTKAFSASRWEAFVCETGGKEVETTVSTAKRRRHCSRECYQEARESVASWK